MAVAVVIFAVVFAMVISSSLREADEPVPAPERVLPLPTPSNKPVDKKQQQAQTEPPQPTVKASDITSIVIPAIGVNAKASGPIMPEATERCKGTDKCMDPPLLDQIAWSDAYATPSSPSSDAVLVYGHSNAYSQTDQVFNNLSALVKQDKVVLITKNGRFTYVVDRAPQLIPFEDIPWERSLYRHTPDRLVLFTCNLSGGGYDTSAVVTATLHDVKPL